MTAVGHNEGAPWGRTRKETDVKKLILLAVFVAAVVVAPVQAKGPKSPNVPKAQKCQPHPVAYTVSGTFSSGSLTLNSDGTYSGSLVVNVTKANDHAKAAKGTTVTYTLTSAKVKLHGENAAALTANSRVKLKGTITTLAKNCNQTGFTAVVTIKKADIKPPKTH
jgi:hypothetical protein